MEEKKDFFSISTVDEKDVPEIIQGQFSRMNDLRNNLIAAKEKAELAGIQAQNAKDMKTGLFRMKGTIESIQETQMALADATIKNTEALEKSFEYQKALAEITKYLFNLGVTNITMNRCVVAELEMRLNQASEEEIDEMAREELKNVIRQLKAQEDIAKKQMDLSIIIKKHEENINNINENLDKEINEIKNDIFLINENNKKINNEIKGLSKLNRIILIGAGIGIIAAIILGIISIII